MYRCGAASITTATMIKKKTLNEGPDLEQLEQKGIELTLIEILDGCASDYGQSHSLCEVHYFISCCILLIE